MKVQSRPREPKTATSCYVKSRIASRTRKLRFRYLSGYSVKHLPLEAGLLGRRRRYWVDQHWRTAGLLNKRRALRSDCAEGTCVCPRCKRAGASVGARCALCMNSAIFGTPPNQQPPPPPGAVLKKPDFVFFVC